MPLRIRTNVRHWQPHAKTGLKHRWFAKMELGVPLSVVSEILGHSSTKITGDLYTHVSLAMQQEAADKMDELFRIDELLSKKD